MEAAAANGAKSDGAADSPTSVLEEEEISDAKAAGGSEDEEISRLNGDVKSETTGEEIPSLPLELEAKNGDTALITETMTKEEEKLLEARVREKEAKEAVMRDAYYPEARFSKLDELLTQTQLYSEFLLEKMDDITFNAVENQVAEEDETKEKKKGRSRKRKSTTAQYDNKRAKTAVAAMLTRSREAVTPEDANLTEEERAEKEQAELVPLMTGGKLKSYQIKGVKWLISLWQNGLNGILADQMGLGKTIQTIGFLAHLKGKGLDGPYMVIAPLSTLSNWVNEVSRFDLSGRGCENQQEVSEEKRRVQVVSKLHAILRPFLLRRMKEDVEQMLPRKKEIILYANMTNNQKQFQDHLANKTLENYLQEKAENFSGKVAMKQKLNNLVIQLRKNCNHPDLLESAFDGSYFYPPIEQLVEQCGKLQLLDRLLTLLLARKHKVLIFSQWTKVLDILDYYLSEKGLEVCRIDGNVKLDERRRQIEAFNDLNSSVNIFILSTRAGGLGINLTAADTCILYDSDWNPQMDLQAMDRCHRIGQTRPVHVYRLATANSVEGRMIKKAFGKLKLEHVVIAKGQFQQDRVKSNTLEEWELLALLRDENDEEDKLIQTDISDEDLLRVMNRSDLVSPASGDAPAVSTLPLKGPGWEVVVPTKSGGGVLSSLSS
ncbi:ATP-dependent DNA helicase DDM1 isoform X3 [Typha latifolia]|uniref:ATP-dependent DNA helicase DDM1 isoform X3 n=1 Tax=Typha latifolia TaxID=4733 RepID=UPI003C2DD3B9